MNLTRKLSSHIPYTTTCRNLRKGLILAQTGATVTDMCGYIQLVQYQQVLDTDFETIRLDSALYKLNTEMNTEIYLIF